MAENILPGDEPHRFGIVDDDRMCADAESVMERLGVRVNVRTELVNLGMAQQQLVEIR